MEEFDEKISLYHAILELEDWLEIKHNPNILKQALDTMENYHCDLERMRYEIAYSDLEGTEKETSMVNSENIDDSEKKRQIEEAYKELDATKQQKIREHEAMMELDNNVSDFIQQEDDIVYEKLPLFKKIQELEDSCGIIHKPNVLELPEDDMWNYYLELMDMPSKEETSSKEGKSIFVEKKSTLIDYSGDDLSLDPNMW